MRKLVSAVAAIAATAAMMTGCSSDSGDKKDAPETTSSSEMTTEEKTTEAESDSEKTSSEETQAVATFPVTVKHHGGELTIDKEPKSIVVFDPSNLDTLDAIGAGDKVVGTSTKFLPEWLKDSDGVNYAEVQDIGSFFEPDQEAIAKLNPDLIIFGPRSAQAYEGMHETFPNSILVMADWQNAPNYSEAVVETVKTIGLATGKVAEAEKAATKIADKIAEYKDMAKDKGSALVVMTSGGELSIHGPKSRWAPIYDVFGFTPVWDDKADEGHKGQKISFETIQELNPDYLFVVDRDAAVGKSDGEAAQAILDNELVASTNAVKNGHVINLDAARWYIVMTGASNYLAELDEVAAGIK